MKSVITVIIIVVGVLLPLAYNLGLFEPKPPEPEPEADLSGWFNLDAYGDLFGGEGGTIQISGDIHNSGEIDGSGTVNMRVFDGYEWRVYHKGTGLVPKGGSVLFEYVIGCERMIVSEVEFTVTIT